MLYGRRLLLHLYNPFTNNFTSISVIKLSFAFHCENKFPAMFDSGIHIYSVNCKKNHLIFYRCAFYDHRILFIRQHTPQLFLPFFRDAVAWTESIKQNSDKEHTTSCAPVPFRSWSGVHRTSLREGVSVKVCVGNSHRTTSAVIWSLHPSSCKTSLAVEIGFFFVADHMLSPPPFPASKDSHTHIIYNSLFHLHLKFWSSLLSLLLKHINGLSPG